MASVTFNGDFQVGSQGTETVLVDLSSKCRSVKFSRNGDILDTTAFGNTSKQWAKGLIDADLSVEVYYDATVWLHLQQLLGGVVPADFRFGPEGSASTKPKVSGTVASDSCGLFLSKIDEDTSVGAIKMLSCTFKIHGTPTLGSYT